MNEIQQFEKRANELMIPRDERKRDLAAAEAKLVAAIKAGAGSAEQLGLQHKINDAGKALEVPNRLETNAEILKQRGVTVVSDIPKELRAQLVDGGKFLIDDWRKSMGPDADKILEAYRKKSGI